MRECPHCKAQIGEDARFCLYCMTPLTEKELILPQKKKNLWWVFVAVGAVLLGLVAALMLLRDRNPVPSQPSSGSSAALTTASTTLSATDTTTDSATESATGSTTESTEETTTESTTESITEPATEATTEPPATNPPATNPPATEPPATESITEPPATEPPVTEPPITEPPATEPPVTEPAATDPPTTEPPTDIATLPRYTWQDPETLCTYLYRAAVQADVLGLDYQVTDNDIVIERVVQEDPDNWIVVPSYIEGKRVIALGAPGYTGYTAAKVYLPETLLAVHDGALPDVMSYWAGNLYITGQTLALENAGKMTQVRSLPNCRNQYGEKFADIYDGWAEWTPQTYGYTTVHNLHGYDDNYQNTDGDIEILDINWPLEGDIYDIPAYIDGKKVVSINSRAFRGTNATAIYLPETLQYIVNIGYAEKTRLQDIYLRSDAVRIHTVLVGPHYNDITLHCSAVCKDGKGRYYKDCVEEYGVKWQEWNG